MLNDRLTFEFADVPRLFFGKEQPRPHRIAVQVPGAASWEDEKAWRQRLMWHAEHFANNKPEAEARSIILYGQKIPGFTEVQPPRPLQVGTKYAVWANAREFHGGTEFVFSPDLPACGHQART